jgi:hypothetical protein
MMDTKGKLIVFSKTANIGKSEKVRKSTKTKGVALRVDSDI